MTHDIHGVVQGLGHGVERVQRASGTDSFLHPAPGAGQQLVDSRLDMLRMYLVEGDTELNFQKRVHRRYYRLAQVR